MSKEFESQPQLSLEAILLRDREQLETFARPGVPLTYERMLQDSFEFSPALDATSLSEQAHDLGVYWPGESTAVHTVEGLVYAFAGKHADMMFAHEASKNLSKDKGARIDTFNNFPFLLSADVDLEETLENGVLQSGQQMADFDAGTNKMYGRAPYLVRAHILASDFMQALKLEVEDCRGIEAWTQRVAEGIVNESCYKPLLTGSRIAYVMMANLMRVDDLQIRQRRYGRPVDAGYITDPVAELRR